MALRLCTLCSPSSPLPLRKGTGEGPPARTPTRRTGPLAQPAAGHVSIPVVSAPRFPSPVRPLCRRVDGLCRAIAACGTGAWLAGPLMLLLWSRLRRTAERFARLAEKVRAGALPPPRRRLRSPRPAQPPPPLLPRGFAWLVRRLPQAASAASQLQHLLADPAMADLLAAAPQAGRLLRPLCQMLGVRPPPARSLSSGRPQAGPVGPPPPVRPAAPSRPACRPRPPPRRAAPCPHPAVPRIPPVPA